MSLELALISIVNASNHTKCVSLSNRKCEIQPTFINLHPNKYSQKFHYYPFTVKLDKCVRSCNTRNDLSNKVCVPYKTEDLHPNLFNMITGISESKTLTKHCHAKANINLKEEIAIQINGRITINVDGSVKNVMYMKKFVWNLAKCNCENGKHLANIADDSAIMCDEIIVSYEEETNFNKRSSL